MNQTRLIICARSSALFSSCCLFLLLYSCNAKAINRMMTLICESVLARNILCVFCCCCNSSEWVCWLTEAWWGRTQLVDTFVPACLTGLLNLTSSFTCFPEYSFKLPLSTSCVFAFVIILGSARLVLWFMVKNGFEISFLLACLVNQSNCRYAVYLLIRIQWTWLEPESSCFHWKLVPSTLSLCLSLPLPFVSPCWSLTLVPNEHMLPGKWLPGDVHN